MEIDQDSVALNLTRRIHKLATAFALALGLLSLVGWTFGLERIHNPFASSRGMSPLAAGALSLVALSLCFRQMSASRHTQWGTLVAGIIVTLISSLSAAIYCVDWHADLQPGNISPASFMRDLLPAEHRMALDTTFTLNLLGWALCTLRRRQSHGEAITEWLAIASTLIPLAALIGYAYGERPFISPFNAPAAFAAMAPHTALGLLMAALAIFTANPAHGWMACFLSTRPAGIVGRKSLPAGVLALFLLGGLSITGEHIGLYGRDETAAIIVALSALTFFLLLQYSMSALAKLDAAMQQTEGDLRKSEEHLRMALGAARISTWEWDIHSNEVKMSGVIAELFGLDEKKPEGSGEVFLAAIHPDDRELVASRAYRAIAGTELYQVEYRIRCPDQMVRWVASRGEVIRSDDGQPLRMTGTTMDITERRLLEKELIEASNREQRRLGQDLHDDLGQWLTAIHLESRALAMGLESRAEPAADHAKRIVTQIGETLERTRLLARGMTPAVIESGGLTAALEELATTTERMFRARCDCFFSEDVSVRDPEAALQLYRIAQEAITNGLRHGNATEIVLTLEPKEDARGSLCVHNNGSSIVLPLPQSSGLGLHIMKYRAGLIGANLDIRPGEDGGTEVVCTFSRDL